MVASDVSLVFLAANKQSTNGTTSPPMLLHQEIPELHWPPLTVIIFRAYLIGHVKLRWKILKLRWTIVKLRIFRHNYPSLPIDVESLSKIWLIRSIFRHLIFFTCADSYSPEKVLSTQLRVSQIAYNMRASSRRCLLVGGNLVFSLYEGRDWDK